MTAYIYLIDTKSLTPNTQSENYLYMLGDDLVSLTDGLDITKASYRRIVISSEATDALFFSDPPY